MESQKLKYFLNNRNFSRKRLRSKPVENAAILQVQNDQIVLNKSPVREEEDEMTTSYTYMSKRASGSKRRWGKDEDEMFYESLKCCGCEFSMINLLFPERTRSNLKEKYKRELRMNSKRIEDALSNYCGFDIERFTALRRRVLDNTEPEKSGV